MERGRLARAADRVLADPGHPGQLDLRGPQPVTAGSCSASRGSTCSAAWTWAINAIGNALRWAENRGRPLGRRPRTAAAAGPGAACRAIAGPGRRRRARDLLAAAGGAGGARRAGPLGRRGGRHRQRRVGLPVALKICSAQITHKSDIGGVALGLRTEARGQGRLREGARGRRGRRRAPSSTGCWSTPMRAGGTELLAGRHRRPRLRPGARGRPRRRLGGGAAATPACACCPSTPTRSAHARRAARRCRCCAARAARAPADLDALAGSSCGSATAALSLGGALRALEVNPLWVDGDQIEALDVLVVTGRTTR